MPSSSFSSLLYSASSCSRGRRVCVRVRVRMRGVPTKNKESDDEEEATAEPPSLLLLLLRVLFLRISCPLLLLMLLSSSSFGAEGHSLRAAGAGGEEGSGEVNSSTREEGDVGNSSDEDGQGTMAKTPAPDPVPSLRTPVNDRGNGDHSSRASLPLSVQSSSPSHLRNQVSSENSRSGKNMRHIEDSDKDRVRLPLVGIGVGHLPHQKIPYVLASALDSNNRVRLVDTSRVPSLEVLVGRSLGRLAATRNNGNNNNSLPSSSSGGGNRGDEREVYHVIIKVRHTHLGYERTMLSVQESLADIFPGAIKHQQGPTSSAGIDGNKASSINALPSSNSSGRGGPDIRVHAILQYPRCYDFLFYSNLQGALKYHSRSGSAFTSCQDEEDSLEENVRNAGPSPLLDRPDAWRRSWHALEELHRHGSLESIGVSDFGPADMEDLYSSANTGPHIYQGSLGTLLSEPLLVEGLVKHGVHYQVYDAARSVVENKESAPRAYAALERLGARNGEADESMGYGYSAVQIVLGWLVQRGIGVIPGTTDAEHLMENAPQSLADVPELGAREALDVETAVLALIEGRDVELEDISSLSSSSAVLGWDSRDIDVADEASQSSLLYLTSGTSSSSSHQGILATFFNALTHKNVRIFYVHPGTGRQLKVSKSIPPGRSGRIVVNPNDVLIAYDAHGTAVKKFLIDGTRGGDEKGLVKMEFSVEL